MAEIVVGSLNVRPSATFLTADRARRKSQADEILAMLRAAGDFGVTNAQLWAVAHAAHSRIADLRARGHVITCRRESPGLYRYVLEPDSNKGESQPLATLPLFSGVAV